MSIVFEQRLAALVTSERGVIARTRVTRLAAATTPALRTRVANSSAKWISPFTSLLIDPYPCRAHLAPAQSSSPSKGLQRGTAALRHRFWHGVVILCTLYVSFASSVQGRLGEQQNKHRGRTAAKSPLWRSRTGPPAILAGCDWEPTPFAFLHSPVYIAVQMQESHRRSSAKLYITSGNRSGADKLS